MTIQNHSPAVFQSIFDAAATMIGRGGVDAVALAEIAYLTGSSIPTMHRYFPNTRPLLHVLATRNLERFLARVEKGSDLASDTPWSSLHTTLSVFEDMYRSEPSFRSLRFGDGIDSSFLTSDEPNMTVIAKALSAMFAETHGVDMTPDMLHHIEVATTTHSALVDLAFQKDGGGDSELRARAMELTLDYLPKHVPLAGAVSS